MPAVIDSKSDDEVWVVRFDMNEFPAAYTALVLSDLNSSDELGTWDYLIAGDEVEVQLYFHDEEEAKWVRILRKLLRLRRRKKEPE